MYPRLAGSATLTSMVDSGPKYYSQVSKDTCVDTEDQSSVMDQPSLKSRGSIKCLRPTKFSPPPHESRFLSWSAFSALVLLIICILIIAIIVSYTLFDRNN
ncbi:uncharacterized protein LOC131935885 [Physella acuta]|uniref:uncharacterized protein LOC131935885 n=1 Tax=Physella acuta TaxID=109671 RepID=UPI0027DCDEB1|nr:uncharacterized protein LOC131935885 [Physella acuta]